MDILTREYKVSEIPQEVIELIETEHSAISNLLNISEMIDEGNNLENFFLDLDDFPVKDQIPDDIIIQFNEYTLSVLGEVFDDMTDKYQTVIQQRDENVLSHLFNVRKLLGEQIQYLDDDKSCETYFIYCLLNGQYYGGIFAFWNSNRPNILFIQAITKFVIPTLLQIFYPRADKMLPRLNSLLDPSITSLARRLGATTIQVIPIENQGSILEKYYGYKKTNDVYFPCPHILGRDNILATIADNHNYSTIYEKVLEE